MLEKFILFVESTSRYSSRGTCYWLRQCSTEGKVIRAST